MSFGGFVASGESLTDVFGVGQDLLGEAFNLSFSFEFPSTDVTVEKQSLPPGAQAISTNSEVLITIGGRSVSLGSNDVRYARQVLGFDHRLSVLSENIVTGGQGTVTSKALVSMRSPDTPFFSSVNPFDPLDYTIVIGRDNPDNVTGFGSFSIVNAPLGGKVSTRAEGVLDVRRVRVSEVIAAPAVPEPATWAMLIAGFGIVGTALRARRTRVPVLA